jgi:hypothetical protein
MLNLGCGLDYIEGAINIDNGLMFPGAKLDIDGDIRKISRDENSTDEILLSHVAMYLRPEELEPLLVKCHRWLKPGGIIEIETIDFDKVLEYAKQNDKSFGLDCIFGTEVTQTHRWGWNVTRLRDIIIKNGFIDLKVSDGSKNPNRDFKIIAKK